MNHDELVENLGTIARSGTAAFMNQLTGDAGKDMALIGQFGVGFYSAFMVADQVEVESRKAGESKGWRWVSDGKGEFTIGRRRTCGAAPASPSISRRARTNISKRPDAPDRRQYSDHIALPIVLPRTARKRRSTSLGAVDAAAIRDHAGAVQGILSPCRPRLRRAVADAACAGRGQDRIHLPAVRAVGEAVRPLRSGAQARGEALCAAGIHHR